MKSDRIFHDIGESDMTFDRVPLRHIAVKQGSVVITQHPRGPIRDDGSGSGVLRAENGMPVGHIDYQEGIVSVLPDYVLDAIEKWRLSETGIPASGHKLNADQTVVVATDVFWNEDMATAPRGTKCQLLGAGGVATYGVYNGDPFWIGWCPLPKRRRKA